MISANFASNGDKPSAFNRKNMAHAFLDDHPLQLDDAVRTAHSTACRASSCAALFERKFAVENTVKQIVAAFSTAEAGRP